MNWTRDRGQIPKKAFSQEVILNFYLHYDYEFSFQGKLIIPNLNEGDAGFYSCNQSIKEKSFINKFLLTVSDVIPHFPQSPLSYREYPTLPESYLNFDITIAFKPQEGEGLIFYNGNNNFGTADFISFGLRNQYPEFRYNLGSGVTLIKADKQLKLGQWHSATISRQRRNCTMKINNETKLFANAGGKFQGLDLKESFFLGGLPTIADLSSDVGYDRGFVGCISNLVLGSRDILDTHIDSVGVKFCDTCAGYTCVNGGVCQEVHGLNGHTCLCPRDYYGDSCQSRGESCYPGLCGDGTCVDTLSGTKCYCGVGRKGEMCQEVVVINNPAFSGDSYLAYPRPKHVLRRLSVRIKFKTQTVSDSLLLFAAQNYDGSGDFLSLTIKDKHLEFIFDTGSGPAVIRSRGNVSRDTWHDVTLSRKLRDGSLTFDNEQPVTGKSAGTTRGLNIKMPFYFGGLNFDKYKLSSNLGNVSGFSGCIGEIELGGKYMRLVEDAVDSFNVAECSLLSPCDSDPCKNGGECQEKDGGTFSCTCLSGFSGDTCDVQETICGVVQPCQNNGVCSGNSTHFTCYCPWGFTGNECGESEFV